MIAWGGYICPNGACYPQDYLSTGGRYNPATNTWTPMNANGAPQSLEMQTAVWTGSVMVAGGINGYESNWTGSRYSPATDTWQPMITNNSLHYCEDAKSVWTGKEVIVWGAPWCTSRYNPVLDNWTAVSSSTCPSLGERGASVIWSGTEMIVWGGLIDIEPGFGYELTNTGCRYNPKTDIWQPTNLENAPIERYNHSAVWTGSKMIIWGGDNSPGGKYNPVNDSWMMMSTTNAPSYYYGYSIVWTGTEMIIWGGGTATNTGSRYKSSSNSWTPISTAGLGNPMPDSRSYNTTVWTGTDIISWGGQSGSQPWGVYTNTGVRYNLATDSWFPTTTINAPTSRAHHAGVWTGTEMIIWGGEYPYMRSGGRYNPATNSWTATSTNNAPIDRFGHSAVWTGAEMIIWGGYSCNDPGCPYTNTGSRYNPTMDSWVATSTNNAPYGREEHTAVWTGSEMIIWGGGYPETNTGGRYNPATDSWTPTTLMNAPAPFDMHTAVWTGIEMIIWCNTSGSRYNPTLDSWVSTSTNNAPFERWGHSAVWTGSEMIIWGGWGCNDSLCNYEGELDTGARYNPLSDSWTATSTINAPAPRSGHAAAWTGQEMIVCGGNTWFEGGMYCAPQSDFSIQCSPSTIDLPPGSNANINCSITSQNYFSAAVALICDQLPSGITCQFQPNSVTPAPNGTVTSTLTIAAAANTPPGNYGLWAQGSNAGLLHHAPVKINVLTASNLRIEKVFIDIHPISLSSNVNGILEPDETVILEPRWTNLNNVDVSLTGTIANWNGPSGAQYTIEKDNADYGTVTVGSTTSCYNATGSCYILQLTSTGSRPLLHWDSTLQETLSDGSIKNWIIHVGASFSDIPVSSMFYPYIEKLLHAGITGGCTNATYCPSLPIPREQMAKYICNSMGAVIPGACNNTGCTSIFTDVAVSNVFCPYIESLYRNGIISGCQLHPLHYCPDNSLQRQAMAKLVCTAMDNVDPSWCILNTACTGIFTDVSSGNPFCQHIEALFNAGVVNGCTTSTFCPIDNVSREQMAKILVNAFHL